MITNTDQSNQDYIWLKIADPLDINKYRTGKECQNEIADLLYQITEFQALLNRAIINQNQSEIFSYTDAISSRKINIKNSIPGFFTSETKKIFNWKFQIELQSGSGFPAIPGYFYLSDPNLHGINIALCKNQLVNNYKDSYYENLLNNKYSFFSSNSEILYTKTILIKDLIKLSNQYSSFEFTWFPDEEIQITSNDKLSIKIWRNDEYKYQNFRDSFSFKTQINWI